MPDRQWTEADRELVAGELAAHVVLADGWYGATAQAVLDALTAADWGPRRRAFTNGAVWALLKAAGTGDHYLDPAELRRQAEALQWGERLVPEDVAGAGLETSSEDPAGSVPDSDGSSE